MGAPDADTVFSGSQVNAIVTTGILSEISANTDAGGGIGAPGGPLAPGGGGNASGGGAAVAPIEAPEWVPSSMDRRECQAIWTMKDANSVWEVCVSPDGQITNTELVVAATNPYTGETVEVAEPLQIWVSQSDLQSLPIDAGSVLLQGDTEHMLINKPMIAWTDAAEHDLSTTILGVDVTVRVTPISYTWDFGNGEAPFTTTDPGGPYPDFTVSAAYPDLTTDNVVTLTTEWSGEFQVAGTGPWLPVAGTATTTSTSSVFDIYEAPARLVHPGG